MGQKVWVKYLHKCLKSKRFALGFRKMCVKVLLPAKQREESDLGTRPLPVLGAAHAHWLGQDSAASWVPRAAHSHPWTRPTHTSVPRRPNWLQGQAWFQVSGEPRQHGVHQEGDHLGGAGPEWSAEKHALPVDMM